MSKSLILDYSGLTHCGLIRTNNQDCFGKFPPDNSQLSHDKGQLFVVADGMGGHRGGQQASQLAVEVLQQTYFGHPGDDISESLESAFSAANSRIYELAQKKPALEGMGTTCTALVLCKDSAYVAHVGDSRAYHISHNTIEQLTQDHSQVGEMQRHGIITEQEARDHPYRSIITRALGAMEGIEVDIIEKISLQAGTSFLLCSDGLNGIADEELARLVRMYPAEKACHELIALANQEDGRDNVTVIVVKLSRKTSGLADQLLTFFRLRPQRL